MDLLADLSEWQSVRKHGAVTRVFHSYFRGNVCLPEVLYVKKVLNQFLKFISKPRVTKAAYQYVCRDKITVK